MWLKMPRDLKLGMHTNYGTVPMKLLYVVHMFVSIHFPNETKYDMKHALHLHASYNEPR